MQAGSLSAWQTLNSSLFLPLLPLTGLRVLNTPENCFPLAILQHLLDLSQLHIDAIAAPAQEDLKVVNQLTKLREVHVGDICAPAVDQCTNACSMGDAAVELLVRIAHLPQLSYLSLGCATMQAAVVRMRARGSVGACTSDDDVPPLAQPSLTSAGDSQCMIWPSLEELKVRIVVPVAGDSSMEPAAVEQDEMLHETLRLMCEVQTLQRVRLCMEWALGPVGGPRGAAHVNVGAPTQSEAAANDMSTEVESGARLGRLYAQLEQLVHGAGKEMIVEAGQKPRVERHRAREPAAEDTRGDAQAKPAVDLDLGHSSDPLSDEDIFLEDYLEEDEWQ